MRRVVIIGAGQAGGEAAQRLRAGGFAGEIVLIGEEPYAPYQRPPLSKKYLSGEMGVDDLLLRPAELLAQEKIEFLSQRRAVWIDRANKRVRLEGGHETAYDALILAPGARPRRLRLPGADLAGVHVVRTIADIDSVKPAFTPGAKLVVIGAGYIGLEIAAVARKLGLDVTVIEAAVRPLARVTSPEMAGFFLDDHTAHGVRFLLGAQPAILKGDARVRAVGLADGAEIEADLVVAGIGVEPETSLAQSCSLPVDNGVLVDADARTADPAIFAIGDCARRPTSFYNDRMVRLESVHNAIEGARIAAAVILGQPRPKQEAPWFWSDQYDLKLQIAGLFNGYDRIVQRGAMADRAFALFYYEGQRLIAVDAVNRPAEYLGAKRLIEKGASPPPDALADISIPMKTLVAQA
ncbi:MAG: NAD(P)-binding protein [Alphaproteobacteria bacterium]|nr:NAD(P)-binding protein [Alphaproteobacteria bacterium]